MSVKCQLLCNSIYLFSVMHTFKSHILRITVTVSFTMMVTPYFAKNVESSVWDPDSRVNPEKKIYIYTHKHLLILTRLIVLGSPSFKIFTLSSHRWGGPWRSHHSSRGGQGYCLWSGSPAAIQSRSPRTPSLPAHVGWPRISLIFFQGLHILFYPRPSSSKTNIFG